jgi:rRNA processing protein Gar1
MQLDQIPLCPSFSFRLYSRHFLTGPRTHPTKRFAFIHTTMPNHNYHGKRKQPTNEEEHVDDLLIASMAVSSTWMPAVDTSNTSKTSDDSSDDGSDAHDKDADEISLDEDDDPDEAVNITEREVPTTVKDGLSSANLETEQDNDINPLNTRIHQDESDDESEIDLTENLANMLDEDEEPKRKDTKNLGIYEGPKTEHEIDPYTFTCPIDELERLDFVGKEEGIDEATKSKLRVAGVVRSYLVEQRTVVVDSLLPASLNQSNSMNEPLDEGSVMAILLVDRSDGACEIATVDEASSLQILGKIIEVFGPVQRPLYVIRLPDPNVENVCFDKTRNADDIKYDEPTLKTESMKAGEEALTESVVVESNLSLDVESQTNTDHEKNRAQDNTSSETSSGAATSDKRKLSDISKVDDPWSANGKLSTILHSTPNAVIYSVIDHSTLINKEHIIKISGKGCGKFPDKHIC